MEDIFKKDREDRERKEMATMPRMSRRGAEEIIHTVVEESSHLKYFDNLEKRDQREYRLSLGALIIVGAIGLGALGMAIYGTCNHYQKDKVEEIRTE